jgi:hypothetical protein
MKSKEITMQIVKNLGNYETARFEATYTLDKGDDVEQSFVTARRELEAAYVKAYEKPKEQPKERPVLTMEMPEFIRCKRAIDGGKVTLAGLQEYFILTEDVITELLKTENKEETK